MKMVKMWDKYDSTTMGVVVQTIKRCVPVVGQMTLPVIDAISRSCLPDDLFEPGEKQKSAPALKRPIQKVSHLNYTFLRPAEDSPMVQGNGKEGQWISRIA